MSDVVIRAENLSKKYRIEHRQERQRYVALRDVFANKISSSWRRLNRWNAGPQSAGSVQETSEDFWALRDVSFEIQQGEVVGIIGRNGAGKSTLLKILSRITEPTKGRVRIRGRVASLLEVGTGFHPELTGRENIYLNGAILGMTRLEIARKFDEIVAFAEVEQFLDTPVKRYSSGMYVRLAFAVAAHLETEILVVDEVLAVGDAAFQKKCLGKMGEVTQDGRTVLFVSHNLVAIQTFCQHAICLETGSMVQQGDVNQVVAHYLENCLEASPTYREWHSPDTAPGIDFLRLNRIAVEPDGDDSDRTIDMQTPLRLSVRYWMMLDNVSAHITLHLINQHGIVVFTTSLMPSVDPLGHYEACWHVPADLLNSGAYSLRVLVIRNGNEQAFELENAISFNVLDASSRQHAFLGREPGIIQPRLQWQKFYLGMVSNNRTSFVPSLVSQSLLTPTQ